MKESKFADYYNIYCAERWTWKQISIIQEVWWKDSMKAVVLVMCKYSVDLQNIQTKILGQQLELRFFFFLKSWNRLFKKRRMWWRLIAVRNMQSGYPGSLSSQCACSALGLFCSQTEVHNYTEHFSFCFTGYS